MTTLYYRILAVCWSVAIAVAYSVPAPGVPAETIIQADKAAHFVMFLGFGFLWMHAIHAAPPDGKRKSTAPGKAAALLAIGVGLSVLAEVYQTFLPRRAAEPYDAAANILGLIVAVGAFWLWYPTAPETTSENIRN